MTVQKAFMDVIYQVGLECDPVITIGPDPDSPTECIRILTKGDEAKEHWGSIDFSIPKEMAIKLGEALIAAGSNQKEST